MSFASNALRATYEPTQLATAFSDHEAWLFVPGGANNGRVVTVHVRLPSLGKPRTIAVWHGLSFHITAGGDFGVMHDTGSGRYYRNISAAQLATYGIVFNTQEVFQLASIGAVQAVDFDPSRYNATLCINGKIIPAVFSNQGFTEHQDGNYNGDGPGLGGFNLYSDFFLVAAHSYAVTDPPLQAAVLRADYNNGRGVNPATHPFLRPYWIDSIGLRANRITGNGALSGLLTDRARFYALPGFSKQHLSAGFAEHLTPVRGTASSWKPAPLPSQRLQDYIYNGAAPVIGRLQNTVFGGYRPKRDDPTIGLLGPIRNSDGGNEMPATWAGQPVILNGNRICGQLAGEVVVSTVTKARASDFYLYLNSNNWEGGQFGAGTHELTYNSLVSMGQMNLLRSRLSRFRLNPEAGAGVLTLSLFNINENPLQQTVGSLMDMATVKPVVFAAENCGPGLTGSPVFSDITESYYAETNGLTGNVPAVPASLRTLWLYNNDLKGIPASWGGITDLQIFRNALSGVHVANQAVVYKIGVGDSFQPGQSQRPGRQDWEGFTFHGPGWKQISGGMVLDPADYYADSVPYNHRVRIDFRDQITLKWVQNQGMYYQVYLNGNLVDDTGSSTFYYSITGLSGNNYVEIVWKSIGSQGQFVPIGFDLAANYGGTFFGNSYLNTLDLSNHAASATVALYADGAYVIAVKWPAAERVFADVRLQHNPGITFPNGFGGALFTGYFWLNHCGNQNYIFPLGTNIRGTWIKLQQLGISSDNLNASIDRLIAGRANFPGPGTAKILEIGGTNQPITTAANIETGASGENRLTTFREVIEADNWIVYSNRVEGDTRSYYRCQVWGAAPPNPGTGAARLYVALSTGPYDNGSVATLYNCDQYNGDYAVIDHIRQPDDPRTGWSYSPWYVLEKTSNPVAFTTQTFGTIAINVAA